MMDWLKGSECLKYWWETATQDEWDKTLTRNQLRQASNPKANCYHPICQGHISSHQESLCPSWHQNPVSYHHPQKAFSPCQGPCSHGDDDWCGIPDWMSGLFSHLCRTDRKVTCSANERAQISPDKCSRPERSAIAEHAINTGHTTDWSNTQIKAVMPPFWQRCILETWYMRSQPHPLNREEGILPHVYDALIIRGDTPHMHGASMAQNWLLGHVLTVKSCMASHSCVYKCLLYRYCCTICHWRRPLLCDWNVWCNKQVSWKHLG